MVKGFVAILLLTMCAAFGQTDTLSVYFEVDSYQLKAVQIEALTRFIADADAQSVQIIEITGWCDDTGPVGYNQVLSEKRAQAVAGYFTTLKPTVVAGRGEVALTGATDIERSRSENRRVDVVATYSLKTEEIIVIVEDADTDIPTLQALREPQPESDAFTGSYKKYGDALEPGDKVLLKNLVFEGGRTELTGRGRRELKKLLSFLNNNPNLHFEIQGHVCCIYDWEKDALDEDTGIPNLSVARARYIYNYLAENGVAPERMSYKGYGRQYPIIGGLEYDNKRVEILIR
jgi:outer membrane protein OmpA-like peptidoglycan-associated protein